MTFWVDAQLSPALAVWLSHEFQVEASALRDLGLRDADDLVIFRSAREARAVILTKDTDFAHLLQTFGSPPCMILITCGNTSNRELRALLRAIFVDAIALLDSGETFIEIG